MGVSKLQGTGFCIGRIREWAARPTVSNLKKTARMRFIENNKSLGSLNATDQPEEQLRLLGIVLVEAYPPSIVRSLPAHIEGLPGASNLLRLTDAKEVLAGRAGSVEYNRQLGTITKKLDDPFGFAMDDSTLPTEFSAASTWQLDFLPSLSLIVTSLSLDDRVSDLTADLYSESIVDLKTYDLQVFGHLGNLRKRSPWSRPKDFRHQTREKHVSVVRREKLKEITEGYSRTARAWFKQYFKGFLEGSKPQESIAFPLFATSSKIPFTTSEKSLSSGILDYDYEIWDSTDPVGWRLNRNDLILKFEGMPSVFAGRLTDLRSLGISVEEDYSNQRIMDEFMEKNRELIEWLSVLRLLEIYSERLAGLRDGLHKVKSIRSRLSKYSRLRDFLEGDALDIASITNEIRRRNVDPFHFEMYSPDYKVLSGGASSDSSLERSLESELIASVDFTAIELVENSRNVIENLRSAAQMRQAIMNFRVQLWLVGITVATLAVTFLLWRRG